MISDNKLAIGGFNPKVCGAWGLSSRWVVWGDKTPTNRRGIGRWSPLTQKIFWTFFPNFLLLRFWWHFFLWKKKMFLKKMSTNFFFQHFFLYYLRIFWNSFDLVASKTKFFVELFTYLFTCFRFGGSSTSPGRCPRLPVLPPTPAARFSRSELMFWGNTIINYIWNIYNMIPNIYIYI